MPDSIFIIRKGKHIIKRIICFISLLIIFAVLPKIGYAAASESEQNVKMLFHSKFAVYNDRYDDKGARISSWDINDAGGRVLSSAWLQMLDESEILPIEAVRKFETVTEGCVTAEFVFSCTDSMEGGGFKIRSGNDDILFLEMRQGILYLGEAPLSSIVGGTLYKVKLDLDFDSGNLSIYINDTLSAEKIIDIPASGADNFYISSGEKATGQLVVRYVKMYTGYTVYEDFDYSEKLPPYWKVYKDDVSSDSTYTNELSSADADTRVETEFEGLNVPFAVEFKMLQPTRRETEFRLFCSDKTAFVMGTTDSYFYCGDEIIYENYLENVWYSIKLIIYPETKTADVYLNGKLKKQRVAFCDSTVSEINRAGFFLIKDTDGTTAKIETIRIYPYETFSDYVPEPEKVTSSKYTIGMQQCPLWHEGELWGNDWLRDSEIRMPILGIYDENSPEAMDWSIKYMAEHGVDFQWICLNLHGSIDEPRNPDLMTGMIHDAYFYAKYSDMVKFAILWENAAVNNWTSDTAYNREMFLKYTVPFWIEYYFKDSRYQTVGGRPMLGIYHWQNFSTSFGTASEVSAMIDAMGDMCEEAGVGRPYIVLSTYLNDIAGWAFDLFESYGIDASYSYNMSVSWSDTQLAYHNTGISAAASRDYDYIPTITMGYDCNVWGGNPDIKITPEDFENYMEEFDSDIGSQLSNIEGEKPIVMAGTWNEFTEGHYFMPTKIDGFSYIDSIRRHLAGDTESHEDVVPTDSQRDRINNMYPSDRKTPVIEKYYPEKVPDGAAVSKEFKFKGNSSGTQNWVAVEGSSSISTFSMYFMGMTVTANADTAMIECDNINLDISSSPYVRIKFKNNSDANSVTMWYTTENNGQISDKRRINRYIKGKSEIVLPVGIYVQDWQGILKALRIGFNGTGSEGTVYIESIEILSVPQEEEAYIYIGSKRYERMKASEPGMIPMSEITPYTGDALYVNSDGEVFYKRRDGGHIIRIYGGKYSINGAEIGSIDGYSISGGEIYVSADTAAIICGREISIDGDNIYVAAENPITVASYIDSSSPRNGTKDAYVTDTVQLNLIKTPNSVGTVSITGKGAEVTEVSVSGNAITASVSGMEAGTKYKMCFKDIDLGSFTTTEYIEFTTKISPSEVFSYDFDGTNHVHWGGGYHTFENTDGKWNINVKKGQSSYFYMDYFSAVADDVKYIDICLKSDNPAGGKVYFRTSNSSSIAEDKVFGYNIEGGKWEYISIPVSGHSLWNGDITQLRLDFSAKSGDTQFSVEYVRLRGESAENEVWICGEAFSETVDGMEIVSTGSVYNNLPDEKKINAFSALYNQKMLNDIAVSGVSVLPHTAENISILRKNGGRIFVWENECLRPVCNEIEYKEPERELVCSWEFNTDGSAEGWGANGWMYGISSAEVSGGVLNIFYPSGDPAIYSDYLAVDAESVKRIEIGLQSDNDYNAKLFYATSNNSVICEEQTYVFDVYGGDEIRNYVIDTSENDGWNSTLTRLRLDFGEGHENNVKLDYIRLYGDIK